MYIHKNSRQAFLAWYAWVSFPKIQQASRHVWQAGSDNRGQMEPRLDTNFFSWPADSEQYSWVYLLENGFPEQLEFSSWWETMRTVSQSTPLAGKEYIYIYVNRSLTNTFEGSKQFQFHRGHLNKSEVSFQVSQSFYSKGLVSMSLKWRVPPPGWGQM